jgi:hypothetical protein
MSRGLSGAITPGRRPVDFDPGGVAAAVLTDRRLSRVLQWERIPEFKFLRRQVHPGSWHPCGVQSALCRSTGGIVRYGRTQPPANGCHPYRRTFLATAGAKLEHELTMPSALRCAGQAVPDGASARRATNVCTPQSVNPILLPFPTIGRYHKS